MRKLGVLLLSTRFDRIDGDIGNPASFSYPSLHRTVASASVERVIGEQDAQLVDLFAAEARFLIDDGATAITTSCGFMARHQRDLAARLPVPIAASALCLTGAAQRWRGPVGVITADSTRLSAEHFTACGAAVPQAVAGMQDSPAFRGAILDQTIRLDPPRVQAELVTAATRLAAAHPELGCLLLECTNLPPYRKAVEAAIGLPVIDALTLCDGLMGAPHPWDTPDTAGAGEAVEGTAPG